VAEQRCAAEHISLYWTHNRAVDVAGPEPNDLPRAQPAAIAERQHDVHLEIARHGEQPLGLLRAHDQRQLLRLLEVVDLGGEIVPPQRDAQQKPHPGHDPVAIGDAQPALHEVQLEAADVIGCRRIGRALQECGSDFVGNRGVNGHSVEVAARTVL
jgi:hypothetical protein